MNSESNAARAVNREFLRCELEGVGISADDLSLFTYNLIGSTNKEALDWGEKNDTGAALFIAERQSAGRGRLGRSFLSPEGGLYMSFLIRPSSAARDTASITAKCAIAVSRAVEALTGLDCKIKWVNDIYVDGRKLAGILTQGRTREDGGLDFAVIGIGINLKACDLGEELKSIATSTEEAGGGVPDRCTLAAAIVREIFSILDDSLKDEILEEYRHRSILAGKSVRVIMPADEYTARVLGIDEGFRLILEREGEVIHLSTGEVSVRADLTK